MFAELNAFFERPEPFSVYTVDSLWTDPHRARGMLEAHLDPDTDLASRRPERIDAMVGWLDETFGFAGKAITDLGCGPGLYAERMARRGGAVTGLDFSENSLAYARSHAAAEKLAITYVKADYLNDPLPGEQDLIMLIYGDICPLSPDRRRRLYDTVRSHLKPGGSFVLDVFSHAAFTRLSESQRVEHHAETGFWADGPHVVLSADFLYPAERIGLNRFLVVTENGNQEVFNWMQYFDEAGIRAELAEAGFGTVTCHAVETGAPASPEDEVFVILARI